MDTYKIEYTNVRNFFVPEILYKYREWDNSFHRKIIEDNTIYMSPPKDFEDKMDCHVPERYPSKIELYNIFLNEAKEDLNFNRAKSREYARDWCKKSPLANPKILEKKIEKYNIDFNARFGVFSLTSDSNNEDMWNKYANNHTGICIGFDSKKLFDVVGGGGKVIYTDVLPTIDFIKDNFAEKHIKNIFFKESKWSFEKEYRLHMFWEIAPTKEERNLPLLENSIVEVILGSRIAMKNKTEIKSIVENKYPDVQIIEL